MKIKPFYCKKCKKFKSRKEVYKMDYKGLNIKKFYKCVECGDKVTSTKKIIEFVINNESNLDKIIELIN